ncbi:MAG: MltA domain-containing protein [Alphaproteobacteria bacterium]
MAGSGLWAWQFPDAEAAPSLAYEKRPVEFSEIEGWAKDDHAAAFKTFRLSCRVFLHPNVKPKPSAEIKAVCELARMLPNTLSRDDARSFFEANFTPYFVRRPEKSALLTGYFEPEIQGSLTPNEAHSVPVYAKPDDLVLITSAVDRGDLPAELTAARMTSEGLKPYYTRREIDEGVLKGRGLEIAYISDPYEAFIMQVQGSGVIKLDNGKRIRIGFAGKNGHPYTSIGKVLTKRGVFQGGMASMPKILSWMRSEPTQAREVMWQNKSYPFFSRIKGDAPRGAMAIPLTPGRSMAVDPRYHQLGMPIWISVPDFNLDGHEGLARLMIAQDTGSAIRGSVRGDFFWGTGPAAGKLAGRMKHPCDFYVFIPK